MILFSFHDNGCYSIIQSNRDISPWDISPALLYHNLFDIRLYGSLLYAFHDDKGSTILQWLEAQLLPRILVKVGWEKGKRMFEREREYERNSGSVLLYYDHDYLDDLHPAFVNSLNLLNSCICFHNLSARRQQCAAFIIYEKTLDGPSKFCFHNLVAPAVSPQLLSFCTSFALKWIVFSKSTANLFCYVIIVHHGQNCSWWDFQLRCFRSISFDIP